jgi:parallel beta-helix repeat protein
VFVDWFLVIGPRQTQSRLRLFFAASLAAALALVCAGPAGAVTTTVNCAPYGSDDLNTAISDASPGDTLVVNGTCTGHFGIGYSLNLQGGLLPHTLDGGAVESTLGIFNETNGGTVSVTIKGLTIRNGVGSFPYGGGINISEPKIDVTLVNTVVTGNHSDDFGGGIEMGDFDQTLTLLGSSVIHNTSDSRGGGIYMGEQDEVATLRGSTVSGNASLSDGGGISVDSSGSLTLANHSTVSGNTARYDAGGIMNSLFGGPGGASITISDSTVKGNTALNDDGGGIDMHDSGVLTLTNSTVGSNVAAGDGAGINVESSNVTINVAGSTIAHNTAGNDPAQGGNGGGIGVFGSGGPVAIGLTNSFVNKNAAFASSTGQGGQGGGIRFRECGANTLTLAGSTVKGNHAASDGGGIYNANTFLGQCGGTATIVATNSQIIDNLALDGRGGGIYNVADNGEAALVSLSGTGVGGNQARFGGGIYNDGSEAGVAVHVSLSSTAVVSNTALVSGGGIFNNAGVISIGPLVAILGNIPNNCVNC